MVDLTEEEMWAAREYNDNYCCEEHTPTLYGLSPEQKAKQIEMAWLDYENEKRLQCQEDDEIARRCADEEMMANRLISEVAVDIKREWKKVYFGAVPYLEAMLSLGDKTDYYGTDSASSVVTYFLSNASSFRGEKAKALKEELKKIIG